MSLKDKESGKLFAFEHKRACAGAPDPGWNYYDRLEAEYSRILDACKNAAHFWRKIENLDYQMVDSYPKFVSKFNFQLKLISAA